MTNLPATRTVGHRCQGAVLAILLILPLAGAADDSQPSLATELSHGYAMLHDAFRRLRHLDLALLMKRESAPVHDAIDRLAESATTLHRSLREMAEADPGISLADQGLTRFELEKRNALMIDRGIGLGMPLLGKTGTALERQALLSISAAVNQQRYLIKVMLDAEQAPPRRKWLEHAAQEMDSIHGEMTALLERDYFCEPGE